MARMADYMASLQHLLTFDHEVYWPGHGGPVREPARYVRGLAAHRRRREKMILDAVRNGAEDIDAIVEAAYPAIAPALAGAASLSTLAHLEWLVERGEVVSQTRARALRCALSPGVTGLALDQDRDPFEIAPRYRHRRRAEAAKAVAR